MAVYNNVIVTEAGLQLLRDVGATGDKALTAVRFVTSESVITNPETATTIPNEVQSINYSLFPSGQSQFTLEAQLTNEGVPSQYTLNSVGYYANDGAGGAEVLLAVITAQTPDIIPPESAYPVNINFKSIIVLDNDGNVTIQASFAGFVTKEEVSDLYDRIAELGDALEQHRHNTVGAGIGVHGFRVFEGALQYYDEDVGDWITITTGTPPTPTTYKTFGVSIDLNNPNPETAVTYIDDAFGMIGGSNDWNSQNIFRGIRPCVFRNGAVQYYLNPSNFNQKEDGTPSILTGADGDVMIEFPKVGYQIVTTGNTMTVRVTDDPAKDGFRYYAHTRDVEGDRSNFYIGAYKGFFNAAAPNALRSISGVTPSVSQTISTFRTRARANGAGYDQFGFYQMTLIQALFLIRFKNRNSQAALGQGYVQAVAPNNTAQNTGATNANPMFFGNPSNGVSRLKCFGIEDLWGNIWDFIDGIWSDANRNIWTAFKDFNDDGTGSQYTNRGQGASANLSLWVTRVQGDTERGFIVAADVGGVTGSETTFFADNGSLNASRLAYFGGDWSSAGHAGVFRLNVTLSASSAGAYVGGRLMYL